MVVPSTIKFNVDHFVCGDSFRCVWAIKEYPPNTTDQAILSRFGDNINARDYIDALQLEESEFDLIKYPERGTCLFKCGNERYLLQVKAPEYKAKLFGDAGGR